MAEKFCLQWNDFRDNVSTAFGSLREDHDFADVTLACEDGKEVEAHKVVLAASSPIFKNLLKRNKNKHPLIYMRGLSSDTLVAILDFLYFGEANVPQESLDDFLALAAELKLKGLTEEGVGGDNSRTKQKATNSDLPIRSTKKTEPTSLSSTTPRQEYHGHIVKNEAQNGGSIVAIPNDSIEYTRDLDSKVKSMMEKSQNTILKQGKHVVADVCKVCGKEGQWVAIRDHIEANHLEGVSLPCDMCDKIYRSRISLRKHISACHK